MIKSMGRLNIDDYKIMDAHVEKVFKNLDKGKTDLAKKQILELADTANYFVREDLGKRLAAYEGPGELDKIIGEMLEDRLYGIRATALFYIYNKRQATPEVIIKTLEKTFETVPWESETICFEMWKRSPEVMKEYMPIWADSDSEKKRAMSMHGMENISSRNPQYILTFVSNLLDDESDEVQKKISHILTQVARQRPLQTYTNIKRWLMEADEKRVRTIWQTMKKLANIFTQRSKKDKTQDFINITQKTIQEWKADRNPKVQQMGQRLAQIMNKK
ncbi:MAG TPA: DNA alkylation repair protein [Candidatus Cloacimonadota bacterium]|nr:DNA alkylation repair protein [Candidatus Cloacimonadota bacterium]HPS38447.1 DNA alkylation repair protein [Candidatus Cloacimonadota bacterium]